MKAASDNQSDIPVREGILLDREGNPIGATETSTGNPAFRMRVFQPRGLLGPVMGVLALGTIAFAGVTLIGFLFAAWAGYLIIRTVLSIFNMSFGSGPPPRGGRYPLHRGQ